jgi:hypothetical protein
MTERPRFRNRAAYEAWKAQQAGNAPPAAPAGPSSPQPAPGTLVACPDCGREISRRATTCPHCGAPRDGAPSSVPLPNLAHLSPYYQEEFRKIHRSGETYKGKWNWAAFFGGAFWAFAKGLVGAASNLHYGRPCLVRHPWGRLLDHPRRPVGIFSITTST